jgi:hypothetical protein
MPHDNSDILDYARERVHNKSVLTRIGHSAKLHSARSAISSPGSFASKGAALATVVARSAMKLIPVPVVGDLLGLAQTAVEGHVRKALHKRSAAKIATGDAHGHVKFKLKELSIEDLDRYRWKLHEAMTQMEAAKAKYNTAMSRRGSADAGQICDTLLEMATAYAQAERRHDRLKERCVGLIASLNAALDWCNSCTVIIEQTKTEFTDQFKQEVQMDDYLQKQNRSDAIQDRHVACGDYCYARSQHHGPDKWAGVRVALATATKLATEPLDLDTFVTFDSKTYKVDKS